MTYIHRIVGKILINKNKTIRPLVPVCCMYCKYYTHSRYDLTSDMIHMKRYNSLDETYQLRTGRNYRRLAGSTYIMVVSIVSTIQHPKSLGWRVWLSIRQKQTL
jgi:hypothetical protein